MLFPSFGFMRAAAGLDPNQEGELDPAHAINDNLVIFVGSHRATSPLLATERVAGGTVTPFGAADFTRVHPDYSDWRCLDVRSTTTAGATLAATAQLLTLSTVWSIWADVIVDSLASFANIFSVPWGTGHTSPFTRINYVRNSTSDGSRANWSDGTLRNADGAAGSFPTTAARRRYWMTRSGATFRFGVNGAQVPPGGDVTDTTEAISWPATPAETQPLTIFNRNSLDTGEGIDGALLALRIWSVEIPVATMGSLNADPQLGLLVPDTGEPPGGSSFAGPTAWPSAKAGDQMGDETTNFQTRAPQ